LFLKTYLVMEPRTGYFCADGIWMGVEKRSTAKQLQRVRGFVHKVQKKKLSNINNIQVPNHVPTQYSYSDKIKIIRIYDLLRILMI